MADIAELMQIHLMGVFGERDGARRRERIAEFYAPDLVMHDPEGAITGVEALDAKAQELLDQAPDFVFSPAGPVEVVHDLGHLPWSFGPAGAPPVVRGRDIALVRDGRIAVAYTILLAE
ncbi:hypothetical protein GCM10009836_19870 [Pseudonocardia ailaonensis]|uniref:SnoaL-like domain-containing protein n=1 Tax=Pseudonocardia ailaonensis TaxID=367279 RepID=A0ABN2MYM1_9PSEU